MKRLGLITTGLAAALLAASAGAKDQKGKPVGDEETPSCHGTSVNFVNTPSEAAKEAKKQEKLVFILHVSGQFEDPGIT